MDAAGERHTAVIIEDDGDIRNLLETVLEQAGFTTVATGNGPDGVKAVKAYNPTVTTLDISLPGIDGFETAKRIRAFSSTYIVMLTARTDEVDTLQGLEAGADDYITKPFRPRELRARIEAMLRRPRAVDSVASSSQQIPPNGSELIETGSERPPRPIAAHGAPTPSVTVLASAPTGGEIGDSVDPANNGWLHHNGLRLHPDERLAYCDEVELALTRSEFDLLEALMLSKRRVRSKADLALHLRGEPYVTSHYVSEADKRAVEVHMANLRKKLGDNSQQPRWIETVRGVGYRMTSVTAG